MKMLYKILGFCLCILPLQLCFAKEIVVDINGTGNFTTIQAAIDNAVNGDTVLVLPGTYFENINYKGKNICVISKAGPDSTIIDGSQPQDFTYRSVVTFLSREDSIAALSGFTITGGTGWYLEQGNFRARAGGGIICDMGSSPIIEKNIIRDNRADGGGGIDIASYGSNPIVRHNIIWRNKASEHDPVWAFAGGGIEIAYNARPMIINNTIVGNECGDGAGGVGEILNGKPLLYNNIIVNNVGGGISGQNSEVKAFYNDVWNNSQGDNLF